MNELDSLSMKAVQQSESRNHQLNPKKKYKKLEPARKILVSYMTSVKLHTNGKRSLDMTSKFGQVYFFSKVQLRTMQNLV